MPIFPERDARFEAFVAPARARPEVWRLVLGVLATVLVWFATAGGMLGLAAPFLRQSADGGRLLLLGFLFTFAGLVLGLVVSLRLFHRRGLGSLLGPSGFSLRGFAKGAGVVFGLSAATAVPLLFFLPIDQRIPLATWLSWAPVALLAVLVQTGAEELAFRGYLMQQLAARFRSRVVWWLLPSILFGLLHWNPATFGANAWLMALAAGLMGLILADVTARTGNLSAAMGLHFANNTVAILLVAVSGELSDLALFEAPLDTSDPAAVRNALLANIAVILVAYAIYLRVLRRRRALQSQGDGSI
jgi:membrane protease YdiL (CAAX protease family)